MGNMNIMLQMRPKPEAIAQKGMIELKDLLQLYNVHDDSDDDGAIESNNNETKTSGNNVHNGNARKQHDLLKKEGPWEVSLIPSLLFGTIHEALKKSHEQTETAKDGILHVMQETYEQVGKLRDSMDQMDSQNVVCTFTYLLIYLFVCVAW
ncbi:hypothetical protein RFI_19380 [Reticulomyxa filosa]|uniref:Uncharacterized protein n=1 Tax=Reticulomyxa filosa TaxID=46433 RepID=X6MXY0_RETFI|nr:hypothetical protein RFI_19380 [Reticulomyxa filosa]|eukprot:ETO17925.1 hypothetical protein RFI_19380 [Reticulomyxa filosa]